MTTQEKRRKNGFLKPSFREILVCSKEELTPYGTVFVIPAENYESEKLGTLFGILKIMDLSADSSYIVNLLASVIKKEYFSRPERSSEESFEASLRKANLALAEIARHGSTSWAGKIDFAGGSIYKNFLNFSHLGNTSIFLIRLGQIADIGRDLDKEKTSEPHPMKTFTDISSGRLEKGDKIIFTTSDLLEIFSPDELRHNAARFSQEEFSGLIEASLQVNAEMGGTIVADLVDQGTAEKQINKPTAYSQVIPSPCNMDSEKKDAPAQTAPPLETRGPIISEILPPEEKEREKHIYIKEEGDEAVKASKWKSAIAVLNGHFQAFKSIFQKIFHEISSVYHKIKIKEKMFFLFHGKTRPGHFVEKIREHSRYFSGHISRIDPRKKKIYFGIVLPAVLLIAVGLIIYKNTSQNQVSEPENQPSAQSEPAVPAVPQDINIKTVSSLEPFASLPQNAAASSILSGSLFAAEENGETIARVDLNSKNVEESSSSLGVGNFELMAPMPNLGALFILTKDKKVVSFTPINKIFQENGIDLPADLNAARIKTYLTYLYFMDPSANQIYRYPRAEGGFGERQNWLKSGSDIKNAVDFAINDDLYVALDSEIIAYFQGKKDGNINFEKPTVPFSIDKIYSEPDMEFIYVLDNKNHRVVQYSKDGKIINQYWNESISGINSIAVDEKNMSIYLIKEKRVEMFSIE